MNYPVFVNRTLNMKKIKYIGLDMDHTLIRYHTKEFEGLVYRLVIDELVAQQNYPEEIKQLTFQFNGAIRGLVVDSRNGNILKLSRYGAIRQSCHGTKQIDFNNQKSIYGMTYVDLGDPNYIAIDTAFSIAFCVLYSQLVDCKDQRLQAYPEYHVMASDVLHAVDRVHAAGHLKQHICNHLDHYVIKDKQLVSGMRRYLQHGKKIFIVTNSEYYYSKSLLDYAINPFLEPGETWQDLFEYVITLSGKPRFFYDQIKFLKIDPEQHTMTNLVGPIKPGVYQGGNARQFTEDLSLNGDEILYIGDHIYGDILRLKKDCNWRTALVVDELGEEIRAQKKALPTEKKIIDAMSIKTKLEAQYVLQQTQKIEEQSDAYDKQLQTLQQEISAIDHHISELLKKQHGFYNPIWDRIFRAGAEETYFAYQVDRFACIYMEKLADLFSYSPLTYFRATKRQLPHDIESSE